MTAPLVYLDNNATTRPDPRVVGSMLTLLTDEYANPSSAHYFGARVAARVEEARRQVAALLGARDREIVFTSGGTEADNTALRGVLAARPDRRHLIISAVEHHAIFETAEQLEREGVTVTRIAVDRDGQLDLASLQAALRPDTALVSIMLANNETGIVFPVREAVALAHARGVPVHSDAVNALGKIPVRVDELGVDLLSISAHKVYGPKGTGALYIRDGTPFQKWQIGGAQERNRRGGTLNAPGIVGLGEACRLLQEQEPAVNEQSRTLRDRLEVELTRRFSNAVIIGQNAPRLPNTTCVCFDGLVGASLVMLLSDAGICISGGAACAAGAVEPSHVLRAMGIPTHLAGGQIRISLGRYNTPADIDRLLDALPVAVREAERSADA